MARSSARISTLVAALFCLAVVGCNSTQTRSVQTSSGSQIGKPVATLISRLGEPVSESRNAGQTVYTWRSDRVHQAGGGAVFVGSNSVYGSAICTLRVYADADDIIQSWDLDDASTTSEGCESFVSAMQ